jgi:predicted transglutaminase-like cysteine proteinase
MFAAPAIIYLLANGQSVAGEFILTRPAIARIERDYGEAARKRVVRWQALIRTSVGRSDVEKLRRVNDFFNALSFVDDIAHWGRKDYWATPLEMLLSNGGDCEDFSIAKYFTLREMGIPADKMRLTYVKALRLNQAHMVLTYFPTPDEDPLVLDNLEQKIVPANARQDLLPVYSFNSNGLWLAAPRLSESKEIGKAERLAPWREVTARIRDELGQVSHAQNYAFAAAVNLPAPRVGGEAITQSANSGRPAAQAYTLQSGLSLNSNTEAPIFSPTGKLIAPASSMSRRTNESEVRQPTYTQSGIAEVADRPAAE